MANEEELQLDEISDQLANKVVAARSFDARRTSPQASGDPTRAKAQRSNALKNSRTIRRDSSYGKQSPVSASTATRRESFEEMEQVSEIINASQYAQPAIVQELTHSVLAHKALSALAGKRIELAQNYFNPVSEGVGGPSEKASMSDPKVRDWYAQNKPDHPVYKAWKNKGASASGGPTVKASMSDPLVRAQAKK